MSTAPKGLREKRYNYLPHAILSKRHDRVVRRNRTAPLKSFRPATGVWRMESLLEPTSELAWVLAAQGYDPLREAIYESRFSISNGLLGLRAGRPVSRGERWVVPQRAYVAGMFDIPSPENPIPALVPAPGWQQIRILLPGGPLIHHPAEAISHRTTLDMKQGVLLTGCRLVDHPTIAVRARTLDLLSLSERGIAVQVVELK